MFGDIEKQEVATKLASEASNLAVLARNGGILGTQPVTWGTNANSEGRLNSSAIDWHKETVDVSDLRYRPELRLGDFERLGKFFSEIVGDGRMQDTNL